MASHLDTEWRIWDEHFEAPYYDYWPIGTGIVEAAGPIAGQRN
jgi:hypothetical protein